MDLLGLSIIILATWVAFVVGSCSLFALAAWFEDRLKLQAAETTEKLAVAFNREGGGKA